eukprot:s465_g1.t1
MAVDQDEADRELIAQNMDSDLQFILSDAGVSTRRQAAIARRYGSLRKFNAIGDDRQQIRNACLHDFAVGQDTPDDRAEVAAIVAAWETAKEFVSKEVELRAEAKVLGQPRILQTHERQAMLKAVEKIHGVLGEAETPSSDYLALKAEETEMNEPTAAPLDEVISKKDTSSSQIQSTVDSSGHLRVTRSVEMFAWLAMSARYKSKHWLHGLEASHFNKFVDVLGIQIPSSSGDGTQQRVKPDWAIVLSFEHKLRKEAMRLVIHENHTLGAVLTAVIRDAELKEAFFTTPVALKAAIPSDVPQNKWARFNSKGSFGGKSSFQPSKGKGGKSGKGKGKDSRLSGLQLAWRTPDGRDLCFAYNSGSCDGKCNRVHQCRVKGCYGDHPAVQHKDKARNAGGASPPEVKVMYLIAGKRRQSDVASYLQKAHDAGHIKLTLKEYDLELSPDHDLTDAKLRDDILNPFEEGDWYLIVSPPCNTFSRGNNNQQQALASAATFSVKGHSLVPAGACSSAAGSAKLDKGGDTTCNAGVGTDSKADFVNAVPGAGSSDDVVDLTFDDDVEEFSFEKCGNYGKPIKVEWDGKFHDFIDGFGLCSPTRWKPRDRGHKRNKAMTGLALSTFECLVEGVHEAVHDIRKEAFKLVTGKLQKSPFTEEMLSRVRAKLASMLRDPAEAMVKDDGQPFYLRMLAQWLEAFEDPDVDCLVNAEDSYATGVNVGVESPLPRSPQVFPPKRKHRKMDDTDFNPLAENYVSAQISSRELEEKFREEELLGRMEPSKLSVLKEKYGDKLRVASMAAILKPDGGVRPLRDATHSVMAVESKEAAFCLSADIKAAHRLVKIRQADWPYLCCRADSLSETVWINKTGNFGVSSAPFWWAKLFAAIGRFVGHLLMASEFWHMVYVDDLHGAFVGARKFEVLWVWLLAFEVIGVIGTPFGYHKFKGGFSSDFVGFHLRYDRNEVGITTKRGTWLADWIRGLEEKKFVVAARD